MSYYKPKNIQKQLTSMKLLRLECLNYRTIRSRNGLFNSRTRCKFLDGTLTRLYTNRLVLLSTKQRVFRKIQCYHHTKLDTYIRQKVFRYVRV